MTQEFTITVFTENQTGLLQRVVSVFTRRHININSLNTSPSSMPNIHRFTIVVEVTEVMVRKLVGQLEKQVDVLKAYYDSNEEIIYQEIALYKVPMKAFAHGTNIEALIRANNARILEIEPEYIVIEKTGHQEETTALLEELREKTGVFEFVRSGRVAVVRPMERLNKYLNSLEVQTPVTVNQ